MTDTPRKELSLFDSTCIIVGVIIGVGIFETAPTVAGGVGSGAATLGLWMFGGLFALCGALCYAELATAYPREGGDYVYLNRAYGPWAGFLFAWVQMVVVRPGDIVLLAYVFGRYAERVHAPVNSLVYAIAAVVLLTVINMIGVRAGKWTQNVLTVIKALGLLAVVGVGLFGPANEATVTNEPAFTWQGFELGMILVMFTFGGWNEMAYVAAEVKQPQRNIVRGLVIGTVVVTALYLLVNAAFLASLGYGRMAGSDAVAVDSVAGVLGGGAGRAVSVLICVSALGAINGLILTGARISYALGNEHRTFRFVGGWNARSGSPVMALIVQGVLCLAIMAFARSFVEAILYGAAPVWIFFLATGVSVFVLRVKEPNTLRPYRVTGFPVPPILFCLSAGFMIHAAVTYAWRFKPKSLYVSGGVIAVGVMLYLVTERSRHRE